MGAVRLLGHPGGLDLLAKLGELLTALVAFAELLLDRLELLAQVVLPLGLGHLALDLRVDLRPELENLHFLRERFHQRLEPRLDVGRLEKRLALDRGQGRQGGGDQVDHPARVADRGYQGQQVVGQRRGQLDDAREEGVGLAPERLGFDVVGGRGEVGHPLDPRPEVRRALRELHHPEPLDALDDQTDRAVGLLEHPVDRRDGARPMEVLGRRCFLRPVALGHDPDQPMAEDGLVDRPDGRGTRDRQRDDRLREEHGFPERQDGQLVRLAGVRACRARGGRARLDADVGLAHEFSSGSPRLRVPPASARDWSRCQSSWHGVQRTAKGWARSRAGAISSSHTSQRP
jgi:hypothetical protein